MSQADSEHHREQAKRARAKAEAATSPGLRQQWLDIVQQYQVRREADAEDSVRRSVSGLYLIGALIKVSRDLQQVGRERRVVRLRHVAESGGGLAEITDFVFVALGHDALPAQSACPRYAGT